MKNKYCCDCRFFEPSSNAKIHGWCHRYPPTVLLSNGEYESKLPTVGFGDFCGDFQHLDEANQQGANATA